LRAPGSLALALVACLSLANAEPAVADPAAWVDPFIGTGGHGHTHPAATLPFGMVQLGPDTRLEGWDGCSGYHHSDNVVYGFSHTHLSGTGVGDYGDILFMPITGKPLLNNGYGTDPDEGYASRFVKSREHAGAGWYAVALASYDIDVELAVTERTGFHRYRYPPGRPAHVIVDLTHRDQTLESSLRVVNETEIEGFRRSTGWARDQVVYFVARFSRPFDRTALAQKDTFQSDSTILEASVRKERTADLGVLYGKSEVPSLRAARPRRPPAGAGYGTLIVGQTSSSRASPGSKRSGWSTRDHSAHRIVGFQPNSLRNLADFTGR